MILQDGFVDPIAQAVPVPVATPFIAPAPIAAPAPVAAPLAVAPAPVAAPLAVAPAPVAPIAPFVLPAASAVHHAPVVKAVVDTPAVVAHQVHAAPFLHHVVAPHFYTSQPAFGHVVKPFVQF